MVFDQFIGRLDNPRLTISLPDVANWCTLHHQVSRQIKQGIHNRSRSPQETMNITDKPKDQNSINSPHQPQLQQTSKSSPAAEP